MIISAALKSQTWYKLSRHALLGDVLQALPDTTAEAAAAGGFFHARNSQLVYTLETRNSYS